MKLHRTPIASAVALALLGPAYAQDATNLNTVVVTGLRASIENSIALKRNNESIVETVTAEDIGKLPDVSIAESLARLPGLAGHRVDGRTQGISIRGMAPGFAATLLNGREMVSTASGRATEFDQFPSEMITAATVYKTPDAALSAQGLSGTVNMQTVRPLDLSSRAINLNARGDTNGQGALVPGMSNMGNRLSASYVDQFADRTIGVAVGLAHLDSPGQQKASNSWWWGNSAIWWGAFRGLENTDPAKAPSTLQGFDISVTSVSAKRDGLMAALEFKPSKDFHSMVDLYYTKFSQMSQGREFQANLMPDWSGDGTPANPAAGGPIYSNIKTIQMPGNAVVVSGNVSNVDPFMVSRYGKRDDKTVALGWNNELKLGAWKTAADLSYSKADRDEFKGEVTGSSTVMSGFTNFNSSPLAGFPSFPTALNWADPKVLGLRGITAWGDVNGVGKVGTGSPVNMSDSLKSLRLSAKRDLDYGPLNSFEGGLNYSDRSKKNSSSSVAYALKNGTPCMNGDNCAPIPAAWLQSPVNLGFAGNPAMLSFDMRSFLASNIYNQASVNQSSAPGQIWGVNEKVTTAFGKVGLEFEAGIPVHGNAGVQVVHADQKATGIAWDGSKGVPMSGGTAYTDVLPSLNLVGDLGSSTLLHFGAAKIVARPDMEAMRAGFSDIAVATTGAKAGMWSASGGNPTLQPWRADSLDLSVERYFGKRSYIAAAVFRKNLKSSIYQQTINYDFTGFPNTSNTVPKSNIGELTAPANGKGGYVQGGEYSASLDGGLFAPSLDGFGMVVSLSDTRSNIAGVKGKNGAPDLSTPMEGLSGQVTSLQLYYEKNGFQARLAQRYRSAYVAEVRGVWVDTSLVTVMPERITDAQIGYSFESGSLKGLAILAQVNNLNNTPYRTQSSDDSATQKLMMPTKYYTYGRQLMLGVSYKY